MSLITNLLLNTLIENYARWDELVITLHGEPSEDLGGEKFKKELSKTITYKWLIAPLMPQVVLLARGGDLCQSLKHAASFVGSVLSHYCVSSYPAGQS